jgi:hypothetical protein
MNKSSELESITSPYFKAFKGFNDDNYISIGDYGQDCKTGRLLAYSLKSSIGHQQHDQNQLIGLVDNMPKGEQYDGLIVGLFYQLSIFIEDMVKDKKLKINDKKTSALTLAKASISRLIALCGKSSYDGGARHLMSDQFFKLACNEADISLLCKEVDAVLMG